MSDISPRLLDRLARGINEHGLCRYVIALANELNVKAIQCIKQGPQNEWFSRMFDCWQKERKEDVSLLALLSAIVRVRRMGRVLREVSKEFGLARSMYADCLKNHIGKHWQQLAYHLGMNRTAVDSIALKYPSGLAMQVDDFLETVRFPDLGSCTLILILVALRAAGLDCVEDEVLREAVSRGYMDEDGHVVADESTGNLVPGDGASVYAAVRSQDPQNRVDMLQGNTSLFQSGEPHSPSAIDQEEAALHSSEERGTSQEVLQMDAQSHVNRQDSLETTSTSLFLAQDMQSRDKQSEGIKAMLDGEDEDMVLALFESDVSQRTAKADDGKLPIHLAVGRRYLKVLDYLIRQCSSQEHLNAQDSKGVTPLMMACNQGQEEAVELLLQSGADPNVLDQLGRMCLHFIETVRNPQILEALCRHKADVNSAESDTRITPLTVAAVFGDFASVKTLVEHGADPNFLRHQSLLPPLVAASQEGNDAVVKFLLETDANQDATNPEGYTALHFAALKQHADVVKCLLEGNSPHPDFLAQDSVTPLMCAAASGSKEIAEALLEKDAEVDAVRTAVTANGKFQIVPLAEAALSGHLAVAEVLVDKGAHVQNRSGGIHSVLEFACVGGNPDIVRLILGRMQFQEGDYADEFQLPLQRAVEMGNYQCAEVIIDHIGLDKLRQEGRKDASIYKELLKALDDYEATLARNNSQLPNTGTEVSRTIGKSSDVFLRTRNQHGSVQRAVDIVKYALLFEPMSAVMVEKQLLIDVCKHILLYSGEVTELFTNALNAGWNDVVHFLADYGNKPDIDNPDDFLRRLEQGDPMTPMQFLTSQVTVDHLWDTAKAEDKIHVEQFFAETQRRTQNGVDSQTARINLRRHFYESAMRDTMARLKESQHHNSADSCPTAFVPQMGCDTPLWDDDIDSALGATVADVQLEQQSEPLQQLNPASVVEEMPSGPSCKPASTISMDASESVCTRSTDSLMPNGRVPPPNSLIFRPQKVHQPLEKCLDKLWAVKCGTSASTTINPHKCRGVLLELSKRVGSKWTFLARFLGLSESTIQKLKSPNGEEHKLAEECCHNMLREWIRQSPSEATWGCLSSALVRIMRADLVDVISEFFQGRVVALQSTEKSIRKEDISTLSFVANQVSSSWPDLAKQLNVRGHIDHGAAASVCDEDQCLTVLMTWLDTFAKAPCFKMLYKALEEIGFAHIIPLLEQRMQ